MIIMVQFGIPYSGKGAKKYNFDRGRSIEKEIYIWMKLQKLDLNDGVERTWVDFDLSLTS